MMRCINTRVDCSVMLSDAYSSITYSIETEAMLV